MVTVNRESNSQVMKPIRKIVIVGGGSAGWMAAAMLSFHLRPEQCRIQLVESSELGVIGVGESTVPPFVGLIQRLGIDEWDFVRATDATYKLGIKFAGWHRREASYFHPFGTIGSRVGAHDFYQCWLRARMRGDVSPLLDFSPCSVMAESGRFFPPTRARNTPIGGANYALHVDAERLAAYLREYALARGVVRTEGRVSRVLQRDEGGIERLVLDDGRELSGDFFLDCTGFRALLIEKALGTEFENWSRFLPCDRAVAVKSERRGAIPPYTLATARNAGWSWRIPLQCSTGHGYVYSSHFCSDSAARSTLMRIADGPLLGEPRVIPFAPGCRREMWKHNCLALGLAAGFLEPLESTSIHLIARGVDFFLRYFPDRDCEAGLIREYNRRMAADFKEVRDFIVLHYCATQREDTRFWRQCVEMALPDSLRERIELFRGHGTLRDGVDELFRSTSWQSVFEGMGIRPRKHCPRVDSVDFRHIEETLRTARAAIRGMVETLPSHDEFLSGDSGPARNPA